MNGKRRSVYVVIIEGDDVSDYFAFRTESVAQRYADKINREAQATDDYDTRASVWTLMVRTAKEMPE